MHGRLTHRSIKFTIFYDWRLILYYIFLFNHCEFLIKRFSYYTITIKQTTVTHRPLQEVTFVVNICFYEDKYYYLRAVFPLFSVLQKHFTAQK